MRDGTAWDSHGMVGIDTVRKELPEAWKTKNVACFSPLALAGRTKLTAKPFQREGERGEGRGNHFKGKGGEGRSREGREEWGGEGSAMVKIGCSHRCRR